MLLAGVSAASMVGCGLWEATCAGLVLLSIVIAI